jgi:hypothetical protein
MCVCVCVCILLGYLRGLQPTQPAMANMTQAFTYWNKGRWDSFWEQGLFLVNLAKRYVSQ